MLKDWFFFPKGDRRAILLLSLVLVVMTLLLWWQTDGGGREEAVVCRADSAVTELRNSAIRTPREMAKSPRGETFTNERRQPRGTTSLKGDSLFLSRRKYDDRAIRWVEKFKTDTVIDLNTADTLLLKRVPGIGSWRARRIVEFRGHLGGYSKVHQLMEIDGMPDSVLRWFAIHTPVHKKINLNRATADEMAAHPYLTYKQARVILRHKRLHGSLQSLDQLSLYEEFTKEQLEKLAPYVAF